MEEVDADATLVFSYIGYVPQKIVVGNQQTLNVQMKEDNQTLEEVVVIGYGVQKKSDVTGAMIRVDPLLLLKVRISQLFLLPMPWRHYKEK